MKKIYIGYIIVNNIAIYNINPKKTEDIFELVALDGNKYLNINKYNNACMKVINKTTSTNEVLSGGGQGAIKTEGPRFGGLHVNASIKRYINKNRPIDPMITKI